MIVIINIGCVNINFVCFVFECLGEKLEVIILFE